MRDDIYGGLRNALERGATIEQAIQSFINAGYNESEIRQVANQIDPSALATVSPQQSMQLPQQNNMPQAPAAQTKMPQQQQAYKPLGSQKAAQKQVTASNGTGKIIILSFILVVLIAALVSVIVFREQIIAFLTNLF